MIRNAEVNVNLGFGQHSAQQYAIRQVPIPSPALTSSDLEPNFKVMASPAKRRAVALSPTLQGYYARLLEKLGPQGWWPARTRLEVVLGAVLAQKTTSWLTNGEALIANAGRPICEWCPLQDLLPATKGCHAEPLATLEGELREASASV